MPYLRTASLTVLAACMLVTAASAGQMKLFDVKIDPPVYIAEENTFDHHFDITLTNVADPHTDIVFTGITAPVVTYLGGDAHDRISSVRVLLWVAECEHRADKERPFSFGQSCTFEIWFNAIDTATDKSGHNVGVWGISLEVLAEAWAGHIDPEMYDRQTLQTSVYVFDTPVPEPATLLLTGTGLLVAQIRCLRRSRSR